MVGNVHGSSPMPASSPGSIHDHLRIFQEDRMVHGIIWWIIVGLIAGWAAGKIMKGGGYGVIADIVLGILGAIIGGWVVGLLGFGGGGLIWSILVAILGAVILIWITRFFKKL